MSDRCALCPGSNACIPPDGPGNADILFIGEGPGKDENRQAIRRPPGRPFVGRSGEEVNRHYLPLAGLNRGRVIFTNAIRCLPTTAGGKLQSSRTADLALLDSCASRGLYPLIERGKFRLLVPLGSFACRAIFGEAFDLEVRHGIPAETPFGIPAFPMYHPALGMYEPKKMLYIRTDWQRLRRYLAGEDLHPQDPYPNPDYREVEHVSEIEDLDPTLPLGSDTESKRDRSAYCFTGSQSPGTGWLIRAERSDLLEGLNARLAQWEAPILFHNWLHDWQITLDMGLRIPHRRVVDTMAEIYHLGNLPQGLKAVAFRELGMEMQDFVDLVSPYSTQNVLIYYQIASGIRWPKPDEEMQIDPKTGLWKLYKPQSMNTKLKRFFTDYSKNEEKDVFGMWEKNWVTQQAMIEEQCGEWPGMCISHVPFDKTLYYACRDADALVRLWPLLKYMRARVRHTTQDRWQM